MSELTALSQRIANVEAENKLQSGQLKEAVEILREVRTAFAGNPELGITGVVATAKSAHRRLDEAERERHTAQQLAKERMDKIEADAAREKWIGRVGSGVMGAGAGAFALWVKGLFMGK